MALIISLALHLLILFFPAFGTIAKFPEQGAPERSQSPSSLSVTLASSRGERSDADHLSTDREATADSRRPEPQPEVKSPLKPTNSRMDGKDFLPLPGTIYYPTSFLTARPQPLGEANLDPPHLRPIVASGKVVLTLWIHPLGEISKISVDSTDLPQNFVSAAVAAFQQLRFRPGELHGQKVGAVMRIEITYDDGRLIKTEVLQ